MFPGLFQSYPLAALCILIQSGVWYICFSRNHDMVYFAHCKFRKESCRTLYTIIVCALLLFLPAGSMQGPVNSMFSCPYGILSGGKDRRVRMWTHKLEPGVTFDCSNYGYNANIRSTCLSSDGTSILIGVKSSEIFEVIWKNAILFCAAFVCPSVCLVDLLVDCSIG